MTIFVDASAMVAMMSDENDSDALADKMERYEERRYSPVVAWEAAKAIARKRSIDVQAAAIEIARFAADFDLKLVEIGAKEGAIAVTAASLYGKGSGHPAKLNMGDCFAYACAKVNGAALLYKGDDFVHTDLA